MFSYPFSPFKNKQPSMSLHPYDFRKLIPERQKSDVWQCKSHQRKNGSLKPSTTAKPPKKYHFNFWLILFVLGSAR